MPLIDMLANLFLSFLAILAIANGFLCDQVGFWTLISFPLFLTFTCLRDRLFMLLRS